MQHAIQKGLAFLQTHQQNGGGFAGFSSRHQNNFTHSTAYQSVFPSALILNCLTLPSHQSADLIKKRLASFLLQQRSEHWSFNYWQRDSAQAKQKPYPDDLDDTFCTLAALTLYDQSLIGSKVMARVVALLTAVESEEGGPYRTWLVPEHADRVWQDVDIAVNSNVAYFLSLHDIELPNLTKFMESAIHTTAFASPYYPSTYPVTYFLSRAYSGNKKEPIRMFLASNQNKDANWGNALNTALAITALLNLGEDAAFVGQSLQWLISQQQPDGSWPASAFCLDPAIDGQTYYAGSSALTTAFCVEALGTYEQSLQKTLVQKTQQRSRAEQLLIQTASHQAEIRLVSLGKELRKNTTTVLHKTLAKDTDSQITLLAHHTRRALGAGGNNVPDALIAILGQANLFGWMAYTIFDNFLDGEGATNNLPTANFFLRQSAQLFSSALAPTSGFSAFTSDIFDTIDGANAWEARYSHVSTTTLHRIDIDHLPNYNDLSQLADKSLGHILPAVAVMAAAGHEIASPAVQHLVTSFRHYIIARQLNDDAHDWQEDLAHNKINAVTALLLRQFLEHYPKSSHDLTNDDTLKRLQEFFWRNTITSICDLVLQRIEKARELLAKSPAIQKPNYIARFFDPVENTARRTLTERNETLEFISEYTRA